MSEYTEDDVLDVLEATRIAAAVALGLLSPSQLSGLARDLHKERALLRRTWNDVPDLAPTSKRHLETIAANIRQEKFWGTTIFCPGCGGLAINEESGVHSNC